MLLESIRSIVREEATKAIQKAVIQNGETTKPFYNIDETAKILGINTDTMYALNRDNKITYHKAGKKCFYFIEDITNYIKQNKCSADYEIKNNVKQLKIGKAV